MNIKEELKDKLKKINQIYLLAQDAYFYTEYFYNPKTDGELELIENSIYKANLSMIRHLMFRTLIIEVSKLFSDSKNDKFRLQSLIMSLSKSGHYRSLGVSKEHIIKWNKLLYDNQMIIYSIITLRNKLYAHTDDPFKDYNSIGVSFHDIKILLDITSSIIKVLYSDIYDIDLRLNSATFDRKRFALLELIVNGEERRMEIANRVRLRK